MILRASRLVSLALVLAACGPTVGGAGGADGASGTGAAGGDESGAVVDDLARLATAMCERQAACACEVPGPMLDAAECQRAHLEGLTRLGEIAGGVAGHELDAACLSALADCWEQLACGQTSDDVCALDCAVHRLNVPYDDACEGGVYRLGPVGFVAECEVGSECLSGHGYSVCDSPAPLEIGETCGDGAYHRSCAADLYCATPGAGPSTCAPRLDEGSACTSSKSCASALRCGAGRCIPRVEIGGPCSDSDACAEGSTCEDGACAACALASCTVDPVCRQVPPPQSYPSGG